MNAKADDQPAVFAYIIATVEKGYRLVGSVPWVARGHVFFGPYKKNMRPKVMKDDYILGISPSGIGRRRVLLWLQVADIISFAEAFRRGNGKDGTGKLYKSLRASGRNGERDTKPIHIKPRDKEVYEVQNGDPNRYEHILGAPHEDDWETDIRGAKDCFLIGSNGSWVAGKDGPVVTSDLVDLIATGISCGRATVDNPLTQNARGKHATIVGDDAVKLIHLMENLRPERSLVNSAPDNNRRCSCSRDDDDDDDQCNIELH